MVSEIWVWDPGSDFRDPDTDGKKASDPDRHSATLAVNENIFY
jgi:hypothetical protein